MSKRSLSEWEDIRRDKQSETDDAADIAEEVKKDADVTIGEFNDQTEPELLETADALDTIAEGLKSDVESQFGEQADAVKISVESEIQDVSNPARDAADNEGGAADDLDAAAQRGERFGENLDRSAGVRREGQETLDTFAEESEGHQEEVTQDISELERQLEEASRGIREFAA